LLNSCGVALVSNSRVDWQHNVVSASHPRQITKECGIQRFCVGNAGNLVRVGLFKLYMGVLQDGRLVAIKCPKNSEESMDFLTLSLEIDSCLSHANIVSLIGYCVEDTELILVYDSLHQQTLRDLLHGTRARHRNPFLVGESSRS
jgi:hypothetical protein